MATHEFDATIKFVAFSGEEQGTFGSAFYAVQAKAAGENVAGMFSNDIIGSSLGQNGERDRHDVRLFRRRPAAERDAAGGRDQAHDGRRERHART